jgi:hypothetical protein
VNGGRVQVAHALGGRVRLSVAALRGRRGVCERVAHRLANEGDVDRVVVRPVTGSVIVERGASELDPKDLAQRLEALVADEHRDEGMVADAKGWPAGSTRLARALVAAWRGIDKDVREALGGEADLRSLVPFVLVATSAAEVSISGKLTAVPWYSLVWYALRSFITFNAAAMHDAEGTNAPAKRDESRAS